MAIKWITWKKWTDFQKSSIFQLNQEEIEIMNNPITSTEIEAMIKNFPKNKAQDQMASQNSIIQRRANAYPSKTLSKNCREGTLPNSFYKAIITLIPKPKITQKKKTTGQYH